MLEMHKPKAITAGILARPTGKQFGIGGSAAIYTGGWPEIQGGDCRSAFPAIVLG
jgi:hypothetical protein